MKLLSYICENYLSRYSSNVIEILKGSLWAFVLKIISAGSGFVMNLVIARQLGVEEAGYFFLSLSIVTVLVALGLQGFNNALIRFIAGFAANKEKRKVAESYSFGILRVLPLVAVFALIIWSFSQWISDSFFSKPLLSAVLGTMGLAVVPLAIIQFHGFAFQGLKRIFLAMFAQSAALPIILIPLMLIVKPDRASDTGVCYLLVCIVLSVVMVLLWFSINTPAWLIPSCTVRVQIGATLGSLFLISFFNIVTQWAGQLMLGGLAEVRDVAIFATAQRTAMLTSFILVAVNAIAAPKFAAAFARNDIQAIKETALASGRIMTLFAIPVVLFILVEAEWIMGWFGPEFRQGAMVLRILAVGQLVNVLTGSVGYLLQMTGRENLYRNNVFAACLLMVVGGFFAAMLWGVTGVAVVTSLALSLQNLMSVYMVNKELGFNTLRVFR